MAAFLRLRSGLTPPFFLSERVRLFVFLSFIKLVQYIYNKYFIDKITMFHRKTERQPPTKIIIKKHKLFSFEDSKKKKPVERLWNR